ncbi:hypothetical protein BDR07DRAFT_1321681 [Suillus spraguei]|nr:hypothetical protein BDR07DRAFT_1321681 [Suillus spraguei]
MLCNVLKQPSVTICKLPPAPHPEPGDVIPVDLNGKPSTSLDTDLPDFSLAALHEYIVKFIIANDQLIIQAWCDYFQVLKCDLEVTITAHWIAKINTAGALKLSASLIAFYHVPGNHTGEALGATILKLLDCAGVTSKVSYFLCFHDMIEHGNKLNWFKDENKQVTKLPVLELLCNVQSRWDSGYVACAYFNRCMPHIVQQVMSGESMPLLSGAIPVFETLMTQWEELANAAPHCKPFIDTALTWASSYYQHMDHTHAYTMAMFVDPSIQLAWIERHWDSELVEKVKKDIREMVSLMQFEH